MDEHLRHGPYANAARKWPQSLRLDIHKKCGMGAFARGGPTGRFAPQTRTSRRTGLLRHEWGAPPLLGVPPGVMEGSRMEGNIPDRHPKIRRVSHRLH